MANKNKEQKSIFFSLEDLHLVDPDRFFVKAPVVNEFVDKKGKKVTWVTSPGYYRNDNGDECIFECASPTQHCWGVKINYVYGKDEEPENMTGYQFCYPLTDMKTVDSPTKAEKAFRNIIDALNNVTVKALQKECSRKETRVPDCTFNSFSAAKAKKNWGYAVKPIYGFQKKKGTKDDDPTKPLVVYFKLPSRGKGKKLESTAMVYGPGDKRVSAAEFINVRGNIDAILHYDGIYWGAHGQKSFGCSTKTHVPEFNYAPLGLGVKRDRRLPPNTAQEEDNSGDEFQHPAGTKNKGFSQPGEETNPPLNDDSDSDQSDSEEEDKKPKKPIKKKVVSKKMTQKQKIAAKKRAAARRRRQAKDDSDESDESDED